jgi:hypothetical protein
MPDIQRMDRLAARLLMVSFFLPLKLQALATITACLYFLGRAVSGDVRPVRQHLWVAAFLGSIYLLHLSAIPLTAPEFRKMLLVLCERKISLLVIPLALALCGPGFRRLIAQELNWFVYGCIASCLAGNAAFLYHYITSGATMTPLGHVAYRISFEKFTGIHPTYMGMFLGFAMAILLLSSDFKFRYGRIIKYLMFYSLLVFLLALLVKSALIAVLIILAHALYLRRKQLAQYKFQFVGMGCAVVGAVVFIPFIGQRLGEVFSFIGIGKPSSTSDNSVYVRKLIVQMDTTLIKSNWLTGIGPARVLHLLQQRYFFYAIVHNSDVGHYDPHSEYFSEWLSFGIAGIALMVGILAFHFRRALLSSGPLYMYCMLLLAMTFFTETVLSRQEGVLFYAIFTSLFCFISIDERTSKS